MNATLSSVINIWFEQFIPFCVYLILFDIPVDVFSLFNHLEMAKDWAGQTYKESGVIVNAMFGMFKGIIW